MVFDRSNRCSGARLGRMKIGAEEVSESFVRGRRRVWLTLCRLAGGLVSVAVAGRAQAGALTNLAR